MSAVGEAVAQPIAWQSCPLLDEPCDSRLADAACEPSSVPSCCCRGEEDGQADLAESSSVSGLLPQE